MARGSDVSIKIYQDGELQSLLLQFRSADWDPGLQEDIDDFLGDLTSTIEGFNGETRLDLSGVVKSGDYFRLLEWQRRKNKHLEPEVLQTVSVTFSIGFGQGDRARILMRNTTTMGGATSMASRTEKVTGALTFVGAGWKRIS